MESISNLKQLIKKGSLDIFYYLDLGIPKFDVILSNDGSIVNKSGKKVSYGKRNADQLMEQLHDLMDDLRSREASQASLF